MPEHLSGVVWALCLDNTDVWADAIWGSGEQNRVWGRCIGEFIQVT